MLIDDGDYRVAEVILGPVERRLARRYYRALVRFADGRWVARERLRYAVASAVECLRNGRHDAALLREAGASPQEVAEGRATARADAQFYLQLAMNWIDRAHLRAA